MSVVIGIIGLGYLAVQNYIHPVRRMAAVTPADYGVPFQDVKLLTRDGLQLNAWYTPPQNGVVVLLAHGYADHRIPAIHVMFAEAGFGALSWDFRAHGSSQGDVSTLGVEETLDVEAALDYALEQPAVDHVAAWGGSMGGAAVIAAALDREEIEAVIVDSAFAAIEDELEIIITFTLLRPIIRFFMEYQTGLRAHEWAPEDLIADISPRPVFIIQGLGDQVVSVDSGKRLYAAAGDPRFLWEEPGVGHLGMFAAFPEDYRLRVVKFFEEALLDGDGSANP